MHPQSASVFRAIAHARKTCKRFQPGRTIEPSILKDILESTLRTPSSFNLQPTQMVLVQDPALQTTLADTAMLGPGNQFRTKQCSAVAVFLADLEASERIRRIYQLEAQHQHRPPDYMASFPISTAFFLGEGHLATTLKQVTMDIVSQKQPMPGIEPIQAWSYKNTALYVQSYVLAATSHNLQTSIMEGLDPRRVKEVLNIPDRYDIPMMVATGYEYEEEQVASSISQSPRLEIPEMVFSNTFGVPLELNSEENSTQEKEERTLTTPTPAPSA